LIVLHFLDSVPIHVHDRKPDEIFLDKLSNMTVATELHVDESLLTLYFYFCIPHNGPVG